MLVICEDCAKKYHIDESRIQGKRAKFSCKACGHIIVVEKPEQTDSNPPVLPPTDPAAAVKDSEADTEAAPPNRKTAEISTAVRGKGKPFLLPLLAVLVAGSLVTGGAFLFLYLRHVPAMISEESGLRSLAVAMSLEQTVKTPLLRKDYLFVNQETKWVARLPGVAYAAVVNAKGAVTAGYFNPQAGFDSRFLQRVKEKGFPVDVLAQNGLKNGAKEGSVRIHVGGLPVNDRVLALTEGDGEVHVGLPVADSGHHLRQVMFSPVLLIPAGLVLLVIILTLLLADWLLIRPSRSLATVANRISLGELDLAIPTEGPRELRELALAVERMRHSVRIAVERLAAKPPQ